MIPKEIFEINAERISKCAPGTDYQSISTKLPEGTSKRIPARTFGTIPDAFKHWESFPAEFPGMELLEAFSINSQWNFE